MAVITAEQLKKRADELDITYTAKMSEEALLAKIEEVEAKLAEEKAYAEYLKTKKEATLKYRVKVTANNPIDRNTKCKLFSVMNSELDESVIVYFDKPWFLTRTMIDHIKNIKYVSIPSNISSDGIGASTVEKEELPAYNVIELGPISEEEFKKMREAKLLNDAAHAKVE